MGVNAALGGAWGGGGAGWDTAREAQWTALPEPVLLCVRVMSGRTGRRNYTPVVPASSEVNPKKTHKTGEAAGVDRAGLKASWLLPFHNNTPYLYMTRLFTERALPMYYPAGAF